MATIIVVGGADTGRAPMVAAFLRYRLADRGHRWEIGSAGVLGHDGDTWQPEARMALENMSIPVPEHTARSLTPALALDADLLLAVDRGVGRALELHFSEARWRSLPDLAGTAREVPDPFRMTLDAWLIYGRELDEQLKLALPAVIALVQDKDGSAAKPAANAVPASLLPAAQQSAEAPAAMTGDSGTMSGAPHPAVDRLAVLVRGIAGIPEVIDWGRARAAIRAALQTLAASIADPSDLRPAAIAMLLGMLGAEAAPLTPRQLVILGEAVDLMAGPIDGAKLGALAGAVGGWGAA